MTAVVVVIPSRGRPGAAWEAVEAVRATASLVSTSVNLVVDADDPELEAYRALRWTGDYRAETWLTVLEPEITGDLVRATNAASMRVAEEDPSAIIGNLGDDHRTRTRGWDRAILNALEEPGIAYGDDLFQGEKLPTAPFISAAIPLALGWYALPACRHLFVDNAWRDLGAQTGRLRYLPGVVVEHMHPLAGKGAWDAGYDRANGQETVDRDRVAYELWRETEMARDVDAVRRALEAAA